MRANDIGERVGGAPEGGQDRLWVAPSGEAPALQPLGPLGGQACWYGRDRILALVDGDILQWRRVDGAWRHGDPGFGRGAWLRACDRGFLASTPSDMTHGEWDGRAVSVVGRRLLDMGDDGTRVLAGPGDGWVRHVTWPDGSGAEFGAGYAYVVASSGMVMAASPGRPIELWTEQGPVTGLKCRPGASWPGPAFTDGSGRRWLWYFTAEQGAVLHPADDASRGYRFAGDQYGRCVTRLPGGRWLLSWCRGAGGGPETYAEQALTLGEGMSDLDRPPATVPDIPPYGRPMFVGPEYVASRKDDLYDGAFPGNCCVLWRDLDWARFKAELDRNGRAGVPIMCDEVRAAAAPSWANIVAVLLHLASSDNWPFRVAAGRKEASRRRVPLYAYADINQVPKDVDGVVWQCYPPSAPVPNIPNLVGLLSAAYTGSGAWPLQQVLDLAGATAARARADGRVLMHLYWPWLSGDGRGHQAEHPEFRGLAERMSAASPGVPSLGAQPPPQPPEPPPVQPPDPEPPPEPLPPPEVSPVFSQGVAMEEKVLSVASCRFMGSAFIYVKNGQLLWSKLPTDPVSPDSELVVEHVPGERWRFLRTVDGQYVGVKANRPVPSAARADFLLFPASAKDTGDREFIEWDAVTWAEGGETFWLLVSKHGGQLDGKAA